MDQTYSSDMTDNRVRRLRCGVCSHEWIPRKEMTPLKCPKCRSMRWNNDFDPSKRCRRCGHEWLSRSEEPAKCPSCQSVKWDSDVDVSRCRRCGHEWVAKGDSKPRKCPGCHSSKWDSEVLEHTCGQCGRKRVMKANSRPGLCPVCDVSVSLYHCVKCDNRWKASRGRAPKKCPSCGSRRWWITAFV